MRALIARSRSDAADSVDALDLHEFYARDWLEAGGVRVNFISSVDGAATADGVSGGLQTPGDNRIFAVLRDLADVVVAGAGTVRTEGYGPARLSAERVDRRRELGLLAALPIAVVSRSLQLDPFSTLFAGAAPGARTIVLTCGAADPDARATLARVADVVLCGDDDVDLAAARAALAERGLTRVLSEGGPTLFGDLARTGVLDELCLSLSPLLAGPGSPRIISGATWPGAALRLHLAGVLEEDGALFLRYRRSQP